VPTTGVPLQDAAGAEDVVELDVLVDEVVEDERLEDVVVTIIVAYKKLEGINSRVELDVDEDLLEVFVDETVEDRLVEELVLELVEEGLLEILE
jgi:hypothetical protein